MSRTLTLSTAIVAIVLGCGGSAAAAGPHRLCSTGRGNPIVSPGGNGRCAAGQRALVVASGAQVSSLRARVGTLEAQVRTLRTTLAGVARSGSTLRFNGMNLQLVSGSGATDGPVNGRGNLIIGYGGTSIETGSHNLVVGSGQAFSSYGGIVGGAGNTLSGPFSVVFGTGNTASGYASSVTGGLSNTASASASSVTAGESNTASGVVSSVIGGFSNIASGTASTARGGQSNSATTDYSAVP